MHIHSVRAHFSRLPRAHADQTAASISPFFAKQQVLLIAAVASDCASMPEPCTVCQATKQLRLGVEGSFGAHHLSPRGLGAQVLPPGPHDFVGHFGRSRGLHSLLLRLCSFSMQWCLLRASSRSAPSYVQRFSDGPLRSSSCPETRCAPIRCVLHRRRWLDRLTIATSLASSRTRHHRNFRRLISQSRLPFRGEDPP